MNVASKEWEVEVVTEAVFTLVGAETAAVAAAAGLEGQIIGREGTKEKIIGALAVVQSSSSSSSTSGGLRWTNGFVKRRPSKGSFI